MSLYTSNSGKIGRILFISYKKHVSNHVSAKDTQNCACQAMAITQTRTFFNLSGKAGRSKEYSGRKLVGHSMDQMFTVVSDIENYNKFVPWCKKSLVLMKKPEQLKADLIIGFPPINERYTSHVTMTKPHLVRAECTEGRLFNHLLTVWRFSPGLRNTPRSCVIDFQVAFEFRSMIHSQLANLFFEQVVMQMEDAFINEVSRRYGKATIPTQIINPGSTLKS